jgi:hypothetical protein
MTTPDHSVQTASQPSSLPHDTASASIPLADLPGGRTDQSPSRWPRVFDLLLAVVVLVFAFLTASFAVRNSDFWMHLAGGRLLAEGRYQFGVDPFAYTTEGTYWANHAWLFDLALYLLYSSQSSGAVLVVVKAALIAVLAALLLSVRRPDGRIVLPAACTLLAMLAMSPFLVLNSTLLSYVFLGLTLWLLWRPSIGPSTSGRDWKRYLPLLLLFVLWVNVDRWFFLGPLLAALFWLGERLQPASQESRRTPAWLWLVGLAVCLINPHHVHAFTLPMELTPLPAELRHDARFERLLVSPWQRGWPYHPVSGVNLAAGAYFALVVLGVLSFVLNARRLLGWRLLVWLSFAGLAAYVERAVPFFAVVAGPITVLDLQDALGRATSRLWIRTLYSAVFVSGLALVCLTWLGWLQGFASARNPVDWAVRPDSSLRRVAETLHHWHKEGKLGADERGFASHPAIVPYFAWFCPEEKGFLDHRLPLFRAAAGDFETVYRALNPALDRERGQSAGNWRKVLRDRGITHLILYDPELTRLLPTVDRLAVDQGDWTLLHIDGLALILGWNDRGRNLPTDVPVFDADRLAFVAAKPGEESMLPPAPSRGPQRDPRGTDFWSHFAGPVPAPSWESAAAAVLLRYFEGRIPRQHQENTMHWQLTLIGQPMLSADGPGGVLRLAVAFNQTPFTPGGLSQQPPALPLLAIRAARHALADNPDDATAYLHLGRAYLDLAGLTTERIVAGSLLPLTQLRHIQIAVALENALRRNPDLGAAHAALVNLYLNGPRGFRDSPNGFLDAALDHLREQVRLTRRDGPLSGESAQAFAVRLNELERVAGELERRVGDLRNTFVLESQKIGTEPYRKAQLALRMGLARLAVDDVLEQSQMVLLGGEGLRLRVELQLMLGRIEPARERLNDPDWQSHKKNLGYLDLTSLSATSAYRLPAYDWLRLCQAAADGDYEQVDAAFEGIHEYMESQPIAAELRRQLREMMPRAVATEIALGSDGRLWGPSRAALYQRLLTSDVTTGFSIVTMEQADLRVLAGMLSLERGLPQAAEESFETALALSQLAWHAFPVSAGSPLAAAYLRTIRAARR